MKAMSMEKHNPPQMDLNNPLALLSRSLNPSLILILDTQGMPGYCVITMSQHPTSFLLNHRNKTNIGWIMRRCALHATQCDFTLCLPDFTSYSQAVLDKVLPILISRLNTSNPVHSQFPHNGHTAKTLLKCFSQNTLTSSKAQKLGVNNVYILHYFLLISFSISEFVHFDREYTSKHTKQSPGQKVTRKEK